MTDESNDSSVSEMQWANEQIAAYINQLEAYCTEYLNSIIRDAKTFDMGNLDDLDFIERNKDSLNNSIDELIIMNRRKQGVANEQDFQQLAEIRNQRQRSIEGYKQDIERLSEQRTGAEEKDILSLLNEPSDNKWAQNIKERQTQQVAQAGVPAL
jgi:hypothetical protein